MNIRSVTTSAVSQPPQPNTPKTPDTVAQKTSADSYQPAQNERLVNMLQEQPDVRPEAVERAKNLAADPNYPGTDVISKLANLFVSDSSE